MSPASARLQVLLAALLFSTGGAAIKATALGAWQVASLRSAIAFGFLVVALPEARRRWTAWTLASASTYAATMVLFVAANKLTTAANAIFLQSMAPLYLLLLGPLLLGEPTSRRDLGFAAVLAAGMAMLFLGAEPARATAPDPALGNALALAAGVAWAFTILSLRASDRRGRAAGGGAASALAAGNFLAALGCLPAALPMPSPSGADLAVLAYLGFFQVGLAYLFFRRGLAHLPALEVSLLVLLEPVLSPFWAWLAHDERPGPWAIAGGLVIVAAMLVRSRSTLAGSRSPRGER